MLFIGHKTERSESISLERGRLELLMFIIIWRCMVGSGKNF